MRLLLAACMGAAAVIAWLVWATGRAIEATAEEDDIQSDPYLVSYPVGGM